MTEFSNSYDRTDDPHQPAYEDYPADEVDAPAITAPDDESPGERQAETVTTDNSTHVAGELDAAERSSFGVVPQEVLNAANPFKFTEDVDPTALRDFYGAPAQPRDTYKGWYVVERSVQDPDTVQGFGEALELFSADMQRHAPTRVYERPGKPIVVEFASPQAQELWFDAALAKANVPAYEERAAYGEVGPDAGRTIYQEVVKDVLPYTVSEGDRAEAIVNALGARAAMLGSPDDFLYPTSPRQGESLFVNHAGQTLNHDFDQILEAADGGDELVPIEVKLQVQSKPGTSQYDPAIVIVHAYDDIGAAVMEKIVARRYLSERRRSIAKFLSRMSGLLGDEVKAGRQTMGVDAASQALQARIAAERRKKYVDPKLRINKW